MGHGLPKLPSVLGRWHSYWRNSANAPLTLTTELQYLSDTCESNGQYTKFTKGALLSLEIFQVSV